MDQKFIKQIVVALFCCMPWWGETKELPVSQSGAQNEALYMEMIQGFLADLHNEKDGCNYYQRAGEYAADNKYVRQVLLLCAITQNKAEQADLYADFIKQEPNDAEDLATYAFYQWRKGNLKEAQNYYEKALAQAPEDTQVLYQYVLLLSTLDIDKAVQTLQSRKDTMPDLAAALDYETGNIYMRSKQWQTALRYYQSAIEARPTYVEPRLAKAVIYEKTSQFFLMMHEYEELEKLGYASADMYNRMGSFSILVKDEPKAQGYFLKAKQLNPSDNVAGYFLAVQAEKEKDWAQAARYLQQTANYPQEAAKWLQVSFYQQQAGDMKAALDTLQIAYKKFDKSVEIGYFYALLLQDVGKYRQAAKVLQGVLETNPSYEQARLAYAFALEASKQYKQMEEQIRLVLAQNPSNAAAYNLLGFSLAERNIRLSEAQEVVTKALSLRPDDRSFIDSLAWVYYQQGKYAQALDVLSAVGPEFIAQNPEVQYHLGAIYAALGENEQARPYLQSAAPTVKPAAKLLKQISR